ncbi:TFP11-domain-containing protein [Corynespora cassiicola Philippines]|uniref:TFP11-domain-containing protein n=1 Tax=Corynespora cassiicola Philippines TaxID=1448308 RepID=A0A2T2P7W8_CORCC|nr:TFP11-domain-containing protein [Corynespora cassiicola Philippines]
MDDAPPKRKHSFLHLRSRKAPKKSDNDSPSTLLQGLGAKLLRAQGWKEGQGLGADGKGMVEPIQVKLRERNTGIGSGQSEKTAQQIREERRRKEQNGEPLSESDDERAGRKKKKSKPAATSGPRPAKQKKASYRLEDLEDQGLSVPPALRSIYDASGNKVDPTALSLRGDYVPASNTPSYRLQKDIAAFGAASAELQSELKHTEEQETDLRGALRDVERQIAEDDDVITRIIGMRQEKDIPALVRGIALLKDAHPKRDVSREAIALLHPVFSKRLQTWSPLDEPLDEIADALGELRHLVESNKPHTDADATSALSMPYAYGTAPSETQRNRRSTSSYETLFVSIWLPQVRAALTQWSVKEPAAVEALISVWKPVLPKFVLRGLLDMVTTKLSLTISEWNARKSAKDNASLPHQWIFCWLPLLTTKHWERLRDELKPRLQTFLRHWPLSRGPPPSLHLWAKAFPFFDRLLLNEILPRLGSIMRDEFVVDPSDQQLGPLEQVKAWEPYVKPEVMAELLSSTLFEELLKTAHYWLTSPDANFEEVGQWLAWWREIIGDEMSEVPPTARKWEQLYTLIQRGVDLEDRTKLELPTPKVESPTTPPVNKEPLRPARQEVEEMTFKDTVEEWCGEQNLLLIPLREAHELTGLPLFRITASATGKGGVKVYMKGDIVYAQNKKNKSQWEPVGLEEGLVDRAEGK